MGGFLGFDSTNENLSATNNQAAATGGGTGSLTKVIGAGGIDQSAAIILGHPQISGTGNTQTINISNLDANVAEDAIDSASGSATAAANVAGYAIQANANIALNANDDLTHVAEQAIDTVSDSVSALTAFGGQYLQGLADATTSAQTIANNVATGADQPLSYNSVAPTESTSPSLDRLSTVIAIVGGLLAIAFYLRKK